MIYAKTGMERMPENCSMCIYCDKQEGICGLDLGAAFKKGRPDWCPLTEIDETLPAQLAAAEARCARMGQILDGME